MKVITVRLSKELHERAKEAGRVERESLNEFCVKAIARAVATSEAGTLLQSKEKDGETTLQQRVPVGQVAQDRNQEEVTPGSPLP